MVLNLTMTYRIRGLNDTLKNAELDGLVETVPALRSILIHYDSRRLPTRMLVDTLRKMEETVPSGENLNIPSRRVELPIAFSDRWTRADIERYVKYTRQDAPKIVNGHNIEYIAQYNGLERAGGHRLYLRHRVVERLHRVLARLAVHVPARPAVRDRHAEVQPHAPVDPGRGGRDRRPPRRDLPRPVPGAVSALRGDHPHL